MIEWVDTWKTLKAVISQYMFVVVIVKIMVLITDPVKLLEITIQQILEQFCFVILWQHWWDIVGTWLLFISISLWQNWFHFIICLKSQNLLTTSSEGWDMGKIAETVFAGRRNFGLKVVKLLTVLPVCVFCHLQTLRFNCLILELERKPLGATLDWEDKDGFYNKVAF